MIGAPGRSPPSRENTAVSKKRESFPTPPPPSRGSCALPHQPRGARWNFGQLPFRPRRSTVYPASPRGGSSGRTRGPAGVAGCAPVSGRGSGPANSRTNAVHTKPFPASAPKGLAWVFATSTKICTRGRSSPGHPRAFAAHPRVLLLGRPASLGSTGAVSVARLSAIHFPG